MSGDVVQHRRLHGAGSSRFRIGIGIDIGKSSMREQGMTRNIAPD